MNNNNNKKNISVYYILNIFMDLIIIRLKY